MRNYRESFDDYLESLEPTEDELWDIEKAQLEFIEELTNSVFSTIEDDEYLRTIGKDYDSMEKYKLELFSFEDIETQIDKLYDKHEDKLTELIVIEHLIRVKL